MANVSVASSEIILFGFDERQNVGFLAEETPLQCVPPPLPSEWVVCKVAEMKRKMWVSFVGMRFQVEDLFREIECRRSYNHKKCDLKPRMDGRESKSRELQHFASSINFEGSASVKNKSNGEGRRRLVRTEEVEGENHKIVAHEDSISFVECLGVGESREEG